MKTHLTFAGLFFLIFLTVQSFGQKRYAVIISGDPKVDKDMGPPNPWPSTNPYIDEFWNDSFLIDQMLIYKFGYENSDVKFLSVNSYGPPTSSIPGLPGRYKWDGGIENTKIIKSFYSLPGFTFKINPDWN